eukprot:200549_1
MAQLTKDDEKATKNKYASANDKEGSETTKGDSSVCKVDSFKALNDVLSKHSMNKMQRMQFMKEVHRRVAHQMSLSIKNAAKDSSKYDIISKTSEIKKLDPQKTTIESLENVHFSNRLNLNYDEWILNQQENEEKFKKEIASILKVDASKIELKQTKKGSVLIVFGVIAGVLVVAAACGYAFSYNGPHIPIDYNMRPDDQIEVKYKVNNQDNWYPATVMSVRQDANQPGKTLTVRYNAENGVNRFWVNTETFNEINQSTRLKLPNRGFTEINGNIVKQHILWQPPALSNANNLHELQPGDHIFMKKTNIWRRCEVIELKTNHEGTSVKVIGLIDNKFKTWRLWKNNDTARMSLVDMRP